VGGFRGSESTIEEVGGPVERKEPHARSSPNRHHPGQSNRFGLRRRPLPAGECATGAGLPSVTRRALPAGPLRAQSRPLEPGRIEHSVIRRRTTLGSHPRVPTCSLTCTDEDSGTHSACRALSTGRCASCAGTRRSTAAPRAWWPAPLRAARPVWLGAVHTPPRCSARQRADAHPGSTPRHSDCRCWDRPGHGR